MTFFAVACVNGDVEAALEVEELQVLVVLVEDVVDGVGLGKHPVDGEVDVVTS